MSTKTSASHSGRMPRENDCPQCKLAPCACTHIANLRRSGRLGWLHDAAAIEVNKPLPLDTDGHLTYHRGGCPCPRCYSLCMATYFD